MVNFAPNATQKLFKKKNIGDKYLKDVTCIGSIIRHSDLQSLPSNDSAKLLKEVTDYVVNAL